MPKARRPVAEATRFQFNSLVMGPFQVLRALPAVASLVCGEGGREGGHLNGRFAVHFF